MLALLVCPSMVQAADEFESRTWTDRNGGQLIATFADAKNGEAHLKNAEGKIEKFKLADFCEPDQKYLRDLSIYRRKLAAGEKASLPADPAKVSLEIQPQTPFSDLVTEPPATRKALFEFPLRTWTDTAGKKIQGKLVTVYNDKVVIDVKGTISDVPVTRLSGDDHQYLSIQLRGLQRDDLVAGLSKAATAGQQPGNTPAAPTAPTTVAANTPTPAAAPGSDDIQARLAQLKAQMQSNDPAPGTPAAANAPPAQPAGTEDINARLAQLRQQLGDSPRGETSTGPSPSAGNSAPPRAEQIMQQHQARMEQQRQEEEERRNRMAAEMQASQEELNRQMQETRDRMHRQVTRTTPAPPPGEMTVMVKKCGNCGRVVPESTSVGDSCPGCGVKFSYDETNVAGSIGYRVGQGLGVLLIISLIGFVVKKITGG